MIPIIKPVEDVKPPKVSGRGLVHKEALKEDVRVAKIGSTPRQWSKKAK